MLSGFFVLALFAHVVGRHLVVLHLVILHLATAHSVVLHGLTALLRECRNDGGTCKQGGSEDVGG